MQFQRNIPLKDYTTFKIGGPAKYFCVVKNKEDLIKAVSFAKEEKLPYFILGGGSNLLVSDKGYGGLVIKMQNTECLPQNTQITAGAGITLARLLGCAANAGLSGLEWASGIPGATLGGAVRGNAGAFNSETKDSIVRVEAFDFRGLKFKTFTKKECKFAYRSSIFKKNPSLIIWSCVLKLENKDKEKIKEKMVEVLSYRREKHPKLPSAGSVFKNLKKVRARDLIEEAGLKGKKIGGAQISEQHANFIVNAGGAKAKDVLKLIDSAKKDVKNKFGVVIEEEIQFLS